MKKIALMIICFSLLTGCSMAPQNSAVKNTDSNITMELLKDNGYF